jgi:hypothetical protein
MKGREEAGRRADVCVPEGCSVCGEDPHGHRHTARELEEWRPGEPCVAGFECGERVAVVCPYCGASHGALDLGWLPEHLPARVRATCCDGGGFHVASGRRG